VPNRKAILVADDSSDDIFLLKRAFLNAGINVPMHFVKDGQEAVDYLAGEDGYEDRTAHPMPLLMLLDLKMPKLDGFDVLRWLQKQPALRRLVVTVLTSSDEKRDVNRAYDLGANSYLKKPSSFDSYAEIAENLRAYWLNLNQHPDCESPKP
jgi:CheY-like chemotaxis protein